jgi:HEPN domain-containing protein
MQFDRLDPQDPKEWLNRAQSNLMLAKAEIPGVYLEDLCFDAQQAAEKALKAFLIHLRLEFPYVHDLAELITLLERSGVAVPGEVREASRLTRFAVGLRYPGVAEPVTKEEYKDVVAIAEATVGWVADLLSK